MTGSAPPNRVRPAEQVEADGQGLIPPVEDCLDPVLRQPLDHDGKAVAVAHVGQDPPDNADGFGNLLFGQVGLACQFDEATGAGNGPVVGPEKLLNVTLPKQVGQGRVEGFLLVAEMGPG